MILTYNTIKTMIGFILGTILLYFINGFHYIIISTIQMIFFTLLYSLIDKITHHSKNNIENKDKNINNKDTTPNNKNIPRTTK